ncbi:MAG: aldehyde dehydrogenase family protein, partial [Mesorhizobium sp.]
MITPLKHLSRNGCLDKFFIDGQWVEPRGTAKGVIVNPATEEVVARFPLGNCEDVDAAVSAARRAFATWSRTKPEHRAGLLDRLQALLEARRELLAQCLTLEMGTAIGYARTAQVPLAIAHVQVARDVLTAFPFVEQRGHTAVTHEPIGVCALITPWNWPLYQITAKVAPALAAGCTVVLKPSELSPLDALLFL